MVQWQDACLWCMGVWVQIQGVMFITFSGWRVLANSFSGTHKSKIICSVAAVRGKIYWMYLTLKIYLIYVFILFHRDTSSVSHLKTIFLTVSLTISCGLCSFSQESNWTVSFKDFVAIFSLDCHFKHFCGLRITQEERHAALAPVEDYILPSNALSSAKDLNFDTFFLMISYQGDQLSIKWQKVNCC
jgi:hypothetical protein